MKRHPRTCDVICPSALCTELESGRAEVPFEPYRSDCNKDTQVRENVAESEEAHRAHWAQEGGGRRKCHPGTSRLNSMQGCS